MNSQTYVLSRSSNSRAALQVDWKVWALEAKLSEIKVKEYIDMKGDEGNLGRTPTVDRLASSH